MVTKLNPTARILTSFLLVLTLPHQLFAAGPAPVNLRSTANFVILSGAAITSSGGGIINGDVGASPIAGSAIGVTCAQVNGTIYAVDASGPACAVIDPTRLTMAKGDLTTAYNDAAGRTPIPSGPNLNPNGGNIGGLNLAPGLYKFTSTALITGADVTLTGGPADVWIFQCAQDLQLGSGIKVILAGGAQARNVFWQVGTSAVLGTSSDFKGTILADQAITMNTSSTMEGRALAFSAGVTFNGSGAGVPTAPAGPEIAVELPEGTDLVHNVSNTDFGPVLIGTDTSLTFTIRNLGSTDLTGLGITIDGVDAALFTVTANPADPVGSNGSTTFTVRFAPLSTGSKAAALNIANNDSDENPFYITITGTGTLIPAPEIAVERPPGTDLVDGVRSTDFGSVNIGTATSLTFTIRNLGSTNLTGLGITINGVDAALFTVTANPQYDLPLASGATVDLLIEYYRANRQTIPQPVYIVWVAPRVSVTETGPPLAINYFAADVSGQRFLIEFSAVPGRRYAVQYSSDATTWKTANPIITAPANRVQWYDDGPPKTESKPTDTGSRFYQIMQLP